MTRRELTFNSRIVSSPVAATRLPTGWCSACGSGGSTSDTGADRFFSSVRPPRDGLAVPLYRANVHPSARAVAAARNQIGEAHFVDLAQVRGHPDLIERARASERDHAHRIQLHPANS